MSNYRSSSKILLTSFLVTLFVFAACESPSEETTATVFSSQQITQLAKVAATKTITAGMTFAQMNTVLSSAIAGDIVVVQPGTYTITGKLTMKAGITLKNQSSTLPIFDASTSSPSQLLEMLYTTDISNCTVSGIKFYNIRYKISGASNVQFTSCQFDYGKRLAGTDKAYLADAYIHFVAGCSSPKVSGCTFSRRSGNSGRGVYNVNSTNCQIINNTFGNGGTTGYFVTAINDNSIGTQISGNVINRKTGQAAAETDHGIYAHTFNGLTITSNTITGWPTDATGGAVKARNGENLNISNNTFNTSGVLLYTYQTGTLLYLKNVLVKNNRINVSGAANDLYHGIGYYRDGVNGTEYSIRLEANILPNGTIKADGNNLNVAEWNANNGGVFSNDINTMYLKAGINNSGNY